MYQQFIDNNLVLLQNILLEESNNKVAVSLDENSCNLKVYISITMTIMQKLIRIFL